MDQSGSVGFFADDSRISVVSPGSLASGDRFSRVQHCLCSGWGKLKSSANGHSKSQSSGAVLELARVRYRHCIRPIGMVATISHVNTDRPANYLHGISFTDSTRLRILSKRPIRLRPGQQDSALFTRHCRHAQVDIINQDLGAFA